MTAPCLLPGRGAGMVLLLPWEDEVLCFVPESCDSPTKARGTVPVVPPLRLAEWHPLHISPLPWTDAWCRHLNPVTTRCRSVPSCRALPSPPPEALMSLETGTQPLGL